MTTAPTRELLSWIATAPRTYDETLEAWRSSCPRLTVWEDAVADGLVRIDRRTKPVCVTLTERGVAELRAT